MEAKLSSAFLSHSSHGFDHETAGVLAEALRQAGLTVWWDEEALEGGQDFPVEILEAIIRHHFFVYIISPRSVSFSWCYRELCCAIDLGKDIIPLLLEEVPKTKRPIQLAPLQYVDIRQGIPASLEAVLRAMGLSFMPGQQVPEDRCARDGRLVEAIANQLPYGKSFTDTLNLVQLLKNIGQSCCETERAHALFGGMASPRNYTGMRIDYDKVKAYLLRGWHRTDDG